MYWCWDLPTPTTPSTNHHGNHPLHPPPSPGGQRSDFPVLCWQTAPCLHWSRKGGRFSWVSWHSPAVASSWVNGFGVLKNLRENGRKLFVVSESPATHWACIQGWGGGGGYFISSSNLLLHSIWISPSSKFVGFWTLPISFLTCYSEHFNKCPARLVRD